MSIFMGVSLFVFSMDDLRFFCRQKGTQALNWERVYESFTHTYTNIYYIYIYIYREREREREGEEEEF
jgi:hypothetical protein